MTTTRDAALTTSTESFVAALTANLAVAGGELVAFVIVRSWIKAVYEPRTYVPPKNLQAPVLGRHILWPLWRIIRADPREIIEKNGVDPYVFIRFLNMMTKALIPIWLISWAVLLPLNSVGTEVAGKVGLDTLTAGNIDLYHQKRFWAHLILDYLFIFWIMYLMWTELQNWLVIRQRFLVDPEHSKLPQANTVLILGIPPDLLDESRLEKLFAHLPGGVKRIWLNRNLREMPSYYDRREAATQKLESAQVQLIKFARTYRLQRAKETEKIEAKGKTLPQSLALPINADMLTSPKPTSAPRESDGDAENGDSYSYVSPEDLGKADQLVPRDKRPMHRLSPLGFLGIGKKVDTIDWARNEIATCTEALREGRMQLQDDVDSPGTENDHYPPLNSAFIHFNQQIAAHMAAQTLIHHKPYNMSEAYVEQSPQNVIWYNLNLTPYDKSLRLVGATAATVGLIIAWAFPVAFIGALSNSSTLIEQYPWMGWLAGDDTGKQVLRGVVCGLLPPILLALVNLILPLILRLLASFQGIPSKTEVELDLMTRYFVFLVIHTFFIITLSSGLIGSIPGLANDPASIAVILQQQMPTASTFFITLILTQFTGTMGTLLQPITLVFYYLKVILGGGTPRSVFSSRYTLQSQQWGQQFPSVTVYAVIMLAYMVISPIITGFGAAFFLVSGVVYKYLFIWVYDQPPEQDTGGLFFPKAITHVFVGMYIQEVALCAFFFLLRDVDLNPSAIPQGALMVVLIAITVGVHYTINASYQPLIHALPLSLANLSYGMPQQDSQAGSYVPGPMSATTRQDRGLNLAGFNIPLPEPLQEVAKKGDKARRELNQRLGGERLNIDTEFARPRAGTASATPTPPTRTPPSGLALAQSDQTPAKGTTAGPPLLMTRDRPPLVPVNHNADDIELGETSSARAGRLDGDLSGDEDAVQIGKGDHPEGGEVDNPFFAVPGGPGIQRRNPGREGDPNAFFHPASKDPQRTIWLPRDELGLAVAEIAKNRECGVFSSCRNATLTAQGKVQITGGPPDDM